MLPKHQSVCELEKPFQKSYYEDEYGAKSIGEPNWKPHVRNALDFPNCQQHSIKGGNGLDWFSKIRCPETVTQEEKEKVSANEQKPTLTREDVEEFRPNKARITKPKVKDQIFDEQTIEQKLRRRKKVQDVRNGVSERASGDKSYYTPEYSEDFHSYGSTLPVANFGGTLKTVPDTFIPLVKLPLQPRIPFDTKEKKKNKINEINEVKQLDFWAPAEPLRYP